MACLALSLQPANGPDILLQSREWFPPARALAAVSAFRHTRLSLSPSAAGPARGLPSSSSAGPASSPSPSADDLDSSLGDDPLAASGGQLVVGVESKYRVVYRLVNSVYVLGVTTADHHSNLFECINTVNQAVSVVVAACRGVDVTPEKLHRKYPEVYMALDIVLRGVGSVRLAYILSSIHGDNIAKMVHTAIDAENRVRGADSWAGGAEALATERRANLEAFSSSFFELPTETLAAGDEVAVAIAPATTSLTEDQQQKDQTEEAAQEEKDPFAASERINKPDEALVGGFKKSKDQTASTADPTLALAGLEVTTLPPAEATKPTFIGVEGFEGDYGGIEFGNEEASLSEAFEGIEGNTPFGGGLDASEFITTTKKATQVQGLTGLELLATGPSPAAATAAAAAGAGTPLENLLVTKTKEMTGPEMYISEEISAEFRESLLARVGLKGTIFLRTLPPQKAAGKETEFSFRLEGTSSIKRAVLQSSRVSSLQNGLFHVRTQSMDDPIPLILYSLQPRLTPLPLRLRLVKRHTGKLLRAMIQYVSNPSLPMPLTNVTFILKLPVEPTLLEVSPKANRGEKEIRWHIPDVPLKGPPGRLRARMPVDQDSADGELDVNGMVNFSSQGSMTLSGVCLRPVSDGIAHFNEVSHIYASGTYLCT
ncbi:unnamed protein product [Musa textilis]